ncbi:hypothetical protein AOL_s00169g261 [Orbilia oligospora ATCC 24927]|uniref:Rhodopsin domain-containing protein n=1 Tax=Arthrobotrys oligospora (strain ATCC 24927 / CBS 115.81 / DSM 1491) TaxID=756982 RepID=G1XN58_ARTOA|nr:hypothetical protein AOL_s00169g261 [Orbilia oligospora ATCC 24927]EGX45655.1 hypothetical protein AOL_s00169g261 [Orbilia oligospora ATCC 24927]
MSDSLPPPPELDPVYAAETRQPLFYGITFALLICSLAVVSLRFYCRAVLIRKIGLDDWLILVGLVLAWVLGVLNYFHVSHGTGKHIETIMFECPKPSMSWSVTFPTGCMNLSVLYYTSASINILTDILILCLPIPVLMTIQIQKRKRIALVGIFFIGFIAVLASVSRIWALWLYQNTKDVSYDAIFILLFSNIEINLAIITASAPPLRPLFKGVFKSSSYGHSYGYPTRSNDGWTGRSRSDGGVQLSRLGVSDDTRRQTKIRGGKEGHTRNESEEEIVAKNSDGIVRTRDINVTITNQQSTESLPV